MTPMNTKPMKKRIVRRIVVKTVVLGFCAASMIAIMIQEGTEAAGGMLFPMTVAVIAAWAASTFRDARRLRNNTYLERAMIAETDERNILLAYKSTRLAAVIIGCAAPVAICFLSYLGMKQAVHTLAATIGFFALAYLASWGYLSRIG